MGDDEQIQNLQYLQNELVPGLYEHKNSIVDVLCEDVKGRKFCVAMTRARMKLIILGDKDTMTRHPFYKKLWEYVEALK